MLTRENKHIYFNNDQQEQLNAIPVGNWVLQKHEWRGLYLTETAAFDLPTKIYGDYEEYADMCLNTFHHKDKMGVLLSGFKGSGKSLLSKLLCVKAEMPVLIVKDYLPELALYLQQIQQPIAVLFDEFEKVYVKEQQNDMLPILDGVFSGKKLFIFTANTAEINQFLINRPSRIFYHRTFDTLPDEVVMEVIEDSLDDKDEAKELVEITKALGQVSMDSLLSIIFQMNLYKVSAREAIKPMNIDVEHARYQVTLIKDGKHHQSQLDGHPLAIPEYPISYKGEKWWEDNVYNVKLYALQIEYGDDGKITLRDGEKTTIIFTRIKKFSFDI